MAHYYDANHTAKEMISHVYIRMVKGTNRGYRLPGGSSLSVLKQEPFKVLRKVGRLAYKLELPPHIKIHPVISIIHLEPVLPDTYNRPRPKPGPILVGDKEEFMVEKIVDHEIRGRTTFYRVRWQGYDSIDDTWEPGPYMESKVPELINRYQRQKRPINNPTLFTQLRRKLAIF